MPSDTNNSNKKSEKSDDSPNVNGPQIDIPNKPRIENKNRINMQTYVEPEQCVGCPGENGGPVFLKVLILSFLAKSVFLSF